MYDPEFFSLKAWFSDAIRRASFMMHADMQNYEIKAEAAFNSCLSCFARELPTFLRMDGVLHEVLMPDNFDVRVLLGSYLNKSGMYSKYREKIEFSIFLEMKESDLYRELNKDAVLSHVVLDKNIVNKPNELKSNSLFKDTYLGNKSDFYAPLANSNVLPGQLIPKSISLIGSHNANSDKTTIYDAMRRGEEIKIGNSRSGYVLSYAGRSGVYFGGHLLIDQLQKEMNYLLDAELNIFSSNEDLVISKVKERSKLTAIGGGGSLVDTVPLVQRVLEIKEKKAIVKEPEPPEEEVEKDIVFNIIARSFIAAEITKDPFRRVFHGDYRGPSLSDEVTARGRAELSYNARTKMVSLIKEPYADDTIKHWWFDVIEKDVDKGVVKYKLNDYSHGRKKVIDLLYSTMNPLTPKDFTPYVDVSMRFVFDLDKENKVLKVEYTFKGDGYPSTEAILEDAAGVRIFIDAKKEVGSPLTELFFGPDTLLCTGNFSICLDENGNFRDLLHKNGDLFSIHSWNADVVRRF